jgi:hypothetical protein
VRQLKAASSTKSSAVWSTDVAQADWFVERINLVRQLVVGGFIPEGFEAYGRILHPAYADVQLVHRVRWAQIAHWSGRNLTPESSFCSIAFPAYEPPGPPPWRLREPWDVMDYSDRDELVRVLRNHTDDGEVCSFCIWNGYGMSPFFAGEGRQRPRQVDTRDPNGGVPESVAAGPKVRFGGSEYYLVNGPLDTASDFCVGPNAYWPLDHSWCVVTTLDAESTLVAGSAALIQELVGSEDVECVETDVEAAVFGRDPEIEAMAAAAVDMLIDSGECEVTTYFGTVRGRLDRKGGQDQSLWLNLDSGGHEDPDVVLLGEGRAADHRQFAAFYMADAIARLAG